MIRLTDDYSEAVKRLLTTTLAVLTLALSACGGGGGTSTTTTAAPVTTEAGPVVTHPVEVFEQTLVANQTDICTAYNAALKGGSDQEQFVAGFEIGFDRNSRIGPMTADDEEALFKFLDTYC